MLGLTQQIVVECVGVLALVVAATVIAIRRTHRRWDPYLARLEGRGRRVVEDFYWDRCRAETAYLAELIATARDERATIVSLPARRAPLELVS